MGFRIAFQKTKQVAVFEYRRQVFNWRFWLGLLGFPLMAGALTGILIVAFLFSRDTAPVGVVGLPGLNLSPPAGEKFTYTFLPFSSAEEARAALLKRSIQAYFVLTPNEGTQLVYLKKPQLSVKLELEALLRRNLLADVPPEQARRVANGAHVTLQSGKLEVSGQVSATMKMMAAFGAIYALLLTITLASSYMSNTLTDERNNRVLEVLVTSVSHDQLLAGKVIGQLAVILTQGLVWVGLPVLVLLILQTLPVPLLGDLYSGAQVLVFGSFGLLTITLFSVLMSILGITVIDTAEGQLASVLFSIFTMLPILVYQSLTAAPSGPLALLLTFFPFTSGAALLVRMSFSSVPAWQILLSLAILMVTTRGAFWLAGRMFWLSLQARTRRKLNLAGLKLLFRRVWSARHA